MERETSFDVLVREILLHELPLVSRCVIINKFDTALASVRSDSLVKTVDLSKHRLSIAFPSDALPSSRGFCTTILLEVKNTVYSIFF